MLNKFSISAPKHHISALYYCRPYSQEIKTIKTSDVSRLKRGTGGRSSFNGNVVTVFGASGFLGRFICNQLGKRGAQIIIPYRSDPDDYNLKKLKLSGDLGQVLFQKFDLRDPLSIRKAIKYSNVVINLIGSKFETKNFNYDDVNVKGAREIAKACREFDIERLIHFSALNVNEPVKRHYMMKIQFLPSKKKGEEAVMEEFPRATIFRPSNIYGDMDSFLWPLCTKFRYSFANLYSIPLVDRGEKTIKQPVFAPDVALGVINAINDYDSRGKIYQIVGPERFYLKDIAVFCAQILQRNRFTSSLVHDIKLDPIFLAKLLIIRYTVDKIWHYPKNNLSLEHIEVESQTDVLDKELPTLEDLGVTLSKMEDKIPHIIGDIFFTKPFRLWDYSELIPADSLSSKALSPFRIV